MMRLATAIAGVGPICFPSTARTSWRPTPGPIATAAPAAVTSPWRQHEDARRRDRIPARPVVAAKHRRALTDRLAYMDAHATAPYDRDMKEGGTDEITTIYLAEGPPEKYQTTGRIDSTDWRTGQPRTDVNVILCAHIQVVYSGVNITSPSTFAQANFARATVAQPGQRDSRKVITARTRR